MTRPDLDAIEKCFRESNPKKVKTLGQHEKSVLCRVGYELLTYCQELEAENKRLRDNLSDHAAAKPFSGV